VHDHEVSPAGVIGGALQAALHVFAQSDILHLHLHPYAFFVCLTCDSQLVFAALILRLESFAACPPRPTTGQ